MTNLPTKFLVHHPIREGKTPEEVSKKIEFAVKFVFDSGVARIQHTSGKELVRGEQCDNVSILTMMLLDHFNIKCRIVYGTARWNLYPVSYEWKGVSEYHAWVETEFGEIVDLACDNISDRDDLEAYIKQFPSPPNCWTKRSDVKDRTYIEYPDGHKYIKTDSPNDPKFQLMLTHALKILDLVSKAGGRIA